MTEENPVPPPEQTVPPTEGVTAARGLFTPPPVPLEPAPQEHRTMGMLTHLLALSGFVGVPFGSIVGPLVIWLMKKDEVPFVDDQGKESLNFQITVLIAMIVLSPTICLFGIGIILIMGVAVAAIVLTIIASVKANQGTWYRYPYTMRLIK